MWNQFLTRRKAFIDAGGNPPVLTKEEEYHLFHILHGEDAQNAKLARLIIILSNMRLVTITAKKFKNFGLSMEDLMQEGTCGLIRATDLFDVHKGYKFSSYAPFWIRQSIGNALEKAPLIYIPPAKRQLLYGLNKDLQAHGLSTASPVELIAKTLGMEESRVVELLELARIKTVSYDALPVERVYNPTITVDRKSPTWAKDTNKGRVKVSPLRGRVSEESPVEEVLSRLSHQQQTIVDMRLNLTGLYERGMTFEEISRNLHMTVTEVTRLYNHSIANLKTSDVLTILTPEASFHDRVAPVELD
jgi:RNA polymerase primary sigma factor